MKKNRVWILGMAFAVLLAISGCGQSAALKEASDDLVAKGYRLKIYDAYRPQKAVTNFVE